MKVIGYHRSLDRLRLIKSLIAQIENDFSEYEDSKCGAGCKNEVRVRTWLIKEMQILDHVNSNDIEGVVSFELSTIRKQILDCY